MNAQPALGMRGTTAFGAPTYRAPKWDERKITSLTQQFAAPGIRQLRRGMTQGMPSGYSPQEVQARRAMMEGYGGALSSIMGGARTGAAQQYGMEYGAKTGAAQADYAAGWKTYGERVRLAKERQGATKVSRRPWMPKWKRLEQERLEHEEFLRGTEEERIRGRNLRMTQEYMGLRKGAASREEGGPVHSSVQAPVYEVGEEGPELYVPDGGQPQVVGTQGPEARTFPQEGEIIPAPETEEIMNKQMQISYDPLPPLSKEEQVIFDAAIGEGGFEATPKSTEGDRENMLIQRKRGGRVTRYERRLQKEARVKQLKGKIAGPALEQNIMNYLTATRFDPSGAGHMPYWQFMLQAQPQKLAGLLGYLQGRKPGFGSGRVSTGPARKKSTRRGFVPERRSGVTTTPSAAGRGPIY
jgi:hypothetical protein